MSNTTQHFFKSILALSLAAAGLLAMPARAEKLTIVTTTSDLASIARAVAGDAATVHSIATGKEDPHFLQGRPSYMMLARKADLWIRVGMDLEIGWESPILNGSRNQRIREGTTGHLDASTQILRLEVPCERITRAMGDVHPHGNPHYWLDPLNGRLVAKTIAQRLITLAPDHAEQFRTNLKQFELALDERMFGKSLVECMGGEQLWALLIQKKLDAFLSDSRIREQLGGWLGIMAPFKNAPIVTHHRSWVYFTNRFGLKLLTELEPKPGVPPSPARLESVVDVMCQNQAKLILLEPFYNRKGADWVARRTEAAVVVCANSTGGQPGTDDYLALLNTIITRTSRALK